MAILPEVTDLLARLASHLNEASSSHQNSMKEDEEEALDLSISKLNRSLNLDEDSSLRVLDSTLSLMCFKAPQVFDSVIKYSVETIVSVLSSSISCKVFRVQKDEVLLIGSSFSRRDCVDLIEACFDIIGKLQEHGAHYNDLLCALLRVAISSSSYQFRYPSRPILDVQSTDVRSSVVSKFLSDFPIEISLDSYKIPFRLLSWSLDPLILKQDISSILHDFVERPFLCPHKEFHERVDWRSFITCLVLSPVMFIQTRALLHRWFLLTGLASVLELLVALHSVILDVVSRPTWWHISSEWGAKLPFSNAYFPYHYHLLRIFSGPLSHDGILQLVHVTSELSSSTGKQFDTITQSSAMNVAAVDHKSIWGLAINFPDWFYFASLLLFSEKSFQENIHAKCVPEASKIGHRHYELPSSIAAARYIAWILSPVSKSHQDLLADYLVKMSRPLAVTQFGSGTHEKKIGSNRKVLKKPKVCDKEYNNPLGKFEFRTMENLLKESKKLYKMYLKKTTKSFSSSDTTSTCDLSIQKNVLFRRILLGILLGNLNSIDEDACELLLHYAATDKIVQLKDTDASRLKKIRSSSERPRDAKAWIDECSEEEVVAGACLVFKLTDIVESMSASLFETEEAGVDFICQVKMRVGKYLIKCMKRQIQLRIGEDKNLSIRDLCKRLKQWRDQGQKALEVHRDVDDVIEVLSHKLSSL